MLYIPPLLSLRREEKKLIITGEDQQIKITKDKNDFFEDKNLSVKYLNLKESNIKNIIRIQIRNYIIHLLIIIHLIQILLSNNNLIVSKFSNIKYN